MIFKPYLTRLLKILLPVSMLLLSACMDIEQEIWIHDDQSATIEYRVGLHEQLLDAATDETPEQACEDFQQNNDALRALDGVTDVSESTRREAGIVYCTTRVDVKQYAQLEQVHQTIMARRDGLRPSVTRRFVSQFSLHEEKGLGLFRQYVKNRAGDEENRSRVDIQLQGLADKLFAQTLSGRYWTVILHAAQIEDNNGERNASKTQVQWRVPLYELLNDKNYAFDMQARFVAALPWYRAFWKWVTDND